MTSNSTNYKLLFAGILAFYVIMTYDHNQLVARVPLEWIKAIIGALAVIYLLWHNVKKNQSGKLDRSQ